MPEFGKNNKSTVEKEEEVMKIKNKILTIMVTGVALSALIMPNKSNAALQSNGGTPAVKLQGDWVLQIRQMQEMGGTLGRTDSINTTNLTSNATDLDIHMEKNTEYGAMAILSASAYGNPNKINDGETTTGNSTGIVINFNNERVSAASSEQKYVGEFISANNRYKNVYSGKDYVAKMGDAILETYNWHGSTNNEWIDYPTNSIVVRSVKNGKSIFSYNAANGAANDGIGNYRKQCSSRACIVVGTGI